MPDYTFQPGARTDSSGNISIPSGNTLNFEGTAGLQFAGTDATAATKAQAAAVGSVAYDRARKIAKVALTATTATTGGAVLAWANPEAVAILITRLTLDVTTKSTGAANANVGVAANGTTSSANLLDTLDVGTAAGTFDNITEKGTLGKSRQKMTTSQFVTVTGSASTAGLVGFAYIEYMLV